MPSLLLDGSPFAGHTFCTIESFNEVAKAVAECAFVTSALPVVLSMEMHCSPTQQRQLAQMLVQHVADALLSVRPASQIITGHPLTE